MRIVDNRLEKPSVFNISYPKDREVREWSFEIFDSNMRRIRGFRSRNLKKNRIVWNGKDAWGKLVKGGSVYQYQMSLEFRDGSLYKSPLRMFGVNRASVISFELTGASFETNSATLNRSASDVLRQVVQTLKKYPDVDAKLKVKVPTQEEIAAIEEEDDDKLMDELEALLEEESSPEDTDS